VDAHDFATGNGRYVVHVSAGSGRLPTSLFLHGGPGLNTAAERRMFAPAVEGHAPFIWVDLLGSGESKAAARPVPHAAIHRIAGGGHFPHLQRPQAVADRVVRFLADLPG
jgi:pimeloyl-ACP methyl ester carboxylesterase